MPVDTTEQLYLKLHFLGIETRRHILLRDLDAFLVAAESLTSYDIRKLSQSDLLDLIKHGRSLLKDGKKSTWEHTRKERKVKPSGGVTHH